MVDKNKAIENLNRNIEFIKERKGLHTDAELCREAGIAKGTLSSVRKGKKVPMVFPFFERLCSYSGYTIDELLGSDLAEESETRAWLRYYRAQGEDCLSFDSVRGRAKDIVSRHLTSPSMLCLISFQDWLSIDEKLRLPDENAERINIPANPRHYWRYRMHLTIEQLLAADELNNEISTLIIQSGRK